MEEEQLSRKRSSFGLLNNVGLCLKNNLGLGLQFFFLEDTSVLSILAISFHTIFLLANPT